MGLCVLTASLRKPNGGGIQDGLQPVLQLATDTSENRVAVVARVEIEKKRCYFNRFDTVTFNITLYI